MIFIVLMGKTSSYGRRAAMKRAQYVLQSDGPRFLDRREALVWRPLGRTRLQRQRAGGRSRRGPGWGNP